MPTFTTEVELFTKTGTGLRVPAEIVEALSERKRPPVLVTVGGHTYRSTVAAYGDELFLPLNRENRAAADVEAGEIVEVRIEVDTEPRVVSVPEDLAAALTEHDVAKASFEILSYSHQREYVSWIEGAKRPETRVRRIAQTIEMLAEGKKRR